MSSDALERIAAALERLSPKETQLPDFKAPAYIWRSDISAFEAIEAIKTAPFECLVGIDRARDILYENTLAFSRGKPANNALLWGARGMGKSSLIKSVVQKIQTEHSVFLIEIAREDLRDLGKIMRLLRKSGERIVMFCDDLSFEYEESVYKSLKAALDGGIAGRPDNVLFYASSNRRHLMQREAMENERETALHDNESTEEKVSLSDRFGLWLGFYPATQDEYLEMVRGYLAYFGADTNENKWRAAALEWSVTRGARSGRVAWQFVTDYLSKEK